MRTTVELDDDVAAALEQLRRERGIGISAALKELARRGLAQGGVPRPRFTQQTSSGGPLIDLTDLAGAFELRDGPSSR